VIKKAFIFYEKHLYNKKDDKFQIKMFLPVMGESAVPERDLPETGESVILELTN